MLAMLLEMAFNRVRCATRPLTLMSRALNILDPLLSVPGHGSRVAGFLARVPWRGFLVSGIPRSSGARLAYRDGPTTGKAGLGPFTDRRLEQSELAGHDRQGHVVLHLVLR